MHQNKLDRPSDLRLREEKCVKISVVNVKGKEYLGNVGVDRSLDFFERERERGHHVVYYQICIIYYALCTLNVNEMGSR